MMTSIEYLMSLTVYFLIYSLTHPAHPLGLPFPITNGMNFLLFISIVQHNAEGM